MNPGTHLSGDERAAWDLIPWVVAGSASAAERSRVERHAAACADCAAELAFQRAVGAAVAATLAAAPLPEVEPGLQRMMARIEADEPVRLDDSAPLRAAPPRSHATRWLAVAAVLQSVVLAGVLGNALLARPEADYVTLSRPETSRATLRLVPAPTLSLRELQALLARFDLRIVDASADGTMFGLVQRQAGPPNAETLAALRATPGVLLAEPIAAPARP